MLPLEERQKQYKDMVQELWNYVIAQDTSEHSKLSFEQKLTEFFDFGISEGQILWQKIRAGYDFETNPKPKQEKDYIITSTSGNGGTVTLHYGEDGKIDGSEFKENKDSE
jgi:hypothetical protein